MRYRQTTLALVFALLLCPFARADHAPAIQNAALLYWPVMYRLSADIAQGFVRMDDIEAGINPVEVEVATKFVTRHHDVIATLAAISRLEHCDWGIDSSRGEVLDLPHVMLMSQTQDFLIASAALTLEKGDHAPAAVSLATSLRMAQHVRAGYPHIFPVDMCVHWFTLAGTRARQALANNTFDAADRAELWHALRRSLGQNPFGFRDMIALERRFRSNDLNKWRTTGISGRLEWMKFVETAASAQMEDEHEALVRLDVGSEEFAKQARLLDEAYAAVIAAHLSVDVKAAMAQVERSVEAGDFGLIASILLPRPLARYESFAAAIDLRDELIAIVDPN